MNLPMKAKPVPYKKFEKLMNSERYFADEKLKGIRAFLHVEASGVKITSSAGKDITFGLPHWQHFSECEHLHGHILDAEAYRRGWDDAVVNGIIHRHDLSEENLEIMPYIFDIPSLGDHSQQQRLEILMGLEENFPEHFTHHPERVFGGMGIKLELYDRVIENVVNNIKGEGIMLKNLDSMYRFGGRHENFWYKLKYTDTYDCIITGYIEGQGKFEGLIGAVLYGQYRDGELRTLGSCSGFTDSQRQAISSDREGYKGLIIEIEAQERTLTGALENPRFKTFRGDKLATDCIWED